MPESPKGSLYSIANKAPARSYPSTHRALSQLTMSPSPFQGSLAGQVAGLGYPEG